MIYIASDHAGFYLKKQLIQYLKVKGLEVEDLGAYVLDEDDDYPDFVYPLATKIALGKPGQDFGIVIGGSGNGEAIVANKVRGIRAAVVNSSNVQIARLAREDNDANVLALGARFLSIDEAKMAVSVWLESKFSGGRHEKRITKIRDLEKL